MQQCEVTTGMNLYPTCRYKLTPFVPKFANLHLLISSLIGSKGSKVAFWFERSKGSKGSKGSKVAKGSSERFESCLLWAAGATHKGPLYSTSGAD